MTKPDMMDKGTEFEAMAIVTNQRHKLRKGYTLVKCRGQQDIKDGKELKNALLDEQAFFEGNEHFR